MKTKLRTPNLQDLLAKYKTTMPPVHPAANLFPPMRPHEFQALVEDIAKTGKLQESVVLHHGQILDGRNRYPACLEAGATPETVEWDGPGTPVDYVLSANLHRRHLTDDARACVAVNIQKYLAAESKHERATKAAAKRHGNEKKTNSSAIPTPKERVACSVESAASSGLRAKSKRSQTHNTKTINPTNQTK